jgi:lactoylglutathione lyase
MRHVFTFNTGPFTVYFLAFPKHGWDEKETFEKMNSRDGLLELMHLHGTEKDKDFKHVNGNESPHWGLYFPAVR